MAIKACNLTLSRLRRQEGSELAVSMGHIASSRSALSTECNFVRKNLRCWGRKGRRKRERRGQVRRAEGEKKREEEKNEKRGKREVERGSRKKGREKADKRWEGRGKRERRRKWTEREEKKGERGKGTRGRLEREDEDRRGKEKGGKEGRERERREGERRRRKEWSHRLINRGGEAQQESACLACQRPWVQSPAHRKERAT